MRLAGCLVFLFLFSGCGGSDDKSRDDDQSKGSPTSSAPTSTSPSASKAKFISASDAICQRVNDKLGAKSPAALSSNDPAVLEQFVTDTLLPSLRDEIVEIRALPKPPGDEATIKRYTDDTDAALDQLEKDPQMLKNPERFNAVFEKPTKEVAAYGHKVCGHAAAPPDAPAISP